MSILKPLKTDHLTKKQIGFLENGLDNLLKYRARQMALRFMLIGIIQESELKAVAELCRERLNKCDLLNEVRVFNYVFDLIVDNHKHKNAYIVFKYLYDNNWIVEEAYEFKQTFRLFGHISFDILTDNIEFYDYNINTLPSHLSILQTAYELGRNDIKLKLISGTISVVAAVDEVIELLDKLQPLAPYSTRNAINQTRVENRRRYEDEYGKIIEESIEHDIEMEEYKHIKDVVQYWNEMCDRLYNGDKQLQ